MNLQTKTGNAFIDNLTASEREVFKPHLKNVYFPKVDESIYKSGALIHFLYFPVDCVFSTIAVTEDGGSAEINLTGNKSVAGSATVFGMAHADYWTTVLIPGSALRIEKQIFRQILSRNSPLRSFLMRNYLSLLTQISQRAVCNGKHRLAERLSSWILLLYDQSGSDALPLTHETIAQKLGMRRAGITAAAGNLQTLKAINYSRGMIHILSRQLLKREACECYQLTKDKFQT